MPYATEAELLEFANAVRQAGGANIIEALLPGEPQVAKACLIANALNFSCGVSPNGRTNEHGEAVWVMRMPANISFKRTQEIAKALGLQAEQYLPRDSMWRAGRRAPSRRSRIILPRLIGNTAAAFDAYWHKGWVAKYRKPNA